jgi:ABC-type antimicrobial peptide transport system permease subunit
MALGAARSEVLWMVLKESVLLLAVGVVLGVPAALAASRIIKSGQFGVGPSDPVTLLAATLCITAVVIASALLPARRATKIDPMVALRYE